MPAGHLNIAIRQHDDRASIVNVDGTIDASTVLELKAAFAEILSHGTRHIVANLRRVEAIDRAGLAALLGSQLKIHQQHGTLRIVSVPSPLRRVLDDTQVSKVLDIYPSQRQALEALRGDLLF